MRPCPPPVAPNADEPRAKPWVWCHQLRQYIARRQVADHLERVHGVNPRMVIQAYGGRGGRGLGGR